MAESVYRRAIQNNPKHTYASYNLAILLEGKAVTANNSITTERGLAEAKKLLVATVTAAPGKKEQ